MVEGREKVEVDITYDDGGSLSVAVYSIDDARLLRSRRIVGEYVGGGAASVQSRNAFSLPLLLSLPEAYTAIAQGIATCSTGCGMNDREALVQIRKRDRRGACEAFEKLWLKGVWLTSGKRYGADFAVYAGELSKMMFAHDVYLDSRIVFCFFGITSLSLLTSFCHSCF
mmetsp:Transcript_26945/g.69297  ORF Transcript_26945/g.69297 Transcript_26945/m.69297 type:complete len:169 (-) Transcript_26945:1284-1790(-)